MLKRTIVILITIGLTASVTASAGGNRQEGSVRNFGFRESIRKQLATLPYYGVFDNLAFELNGNTVVLYGQVVRPTTRKEAERRVARMEGVARVINKIEVAPSTSTRSFKRLFVCNCELR